MPETAVMMPRMPRVPMEAKAVLDALVERTGLTPERVVTLALEAYSRHEWDITLNSSRPTVNGAEPSSRQDKRWSLSEVRVLREFYLPRREPRERWGCALTGAPEPTRCLACTSPAICAAKYLPGRDVAAIKQRAYRLRRNKS